MTKNRSIILNILRFFLPSVLTLLWLCFIYGNSLQTGVESGEASGQVHHIMNMPFEFFGLGTPLSEYFIRKAAHFTEFFILGALVCADLWCFSVLTLRRRLEYSILVISSALPVCTALAACDEYLQGFVDGRGSSVKDVLIDTSGAFTAILIFGVLFYIVRIIYSHSKAKVKAGN